MVNKVKERIKQIATTISNSTKDNGFQIHTSHFPELTAWTGPLAQGFYDNYFLTRLAFEYLQTNKSTLKIDVTRTIEFEPNYTDEEGSFSDIVDNFSSTLEQAIKAKGLDIDKVNIVFNTFKDDNDNQVISFYAKYNELESESEYSGRLKKIETAEKIFKFIDSVFDKRIEELKAVHKNKASRKEELNALCAKHRRKLKSLTEVGTNES